MSKKEPSKLRKVVGSTVLAPVNLVFNRGTKSSGKVYSDAIKAQSKIYCPKCTQGVFQLLNNNTDKDDDDNSGGHTPQIWACSHCDLEVHTQTNSQKELINTLNANSHRWYQEGLESGLNDFSEDQRERGVKNLIKKALVFYVLALMCLLFLPYFVLNSTTLPTINMVLLLVFLTFSGMAQAFKAFKLHNDLLFHHEPKTLLVAWLKKGHYLKPWKYQATRRA